MEKPTVYLETSVIGYLTARLSRDIITAAHQQITQEWWEDRRNQFDLRISQPVLDESGAGDLPEAKRRLQILQNLPLLAVTDESRDLARILIEQGPLTARANVDALHMAIAAVSGIDYLLTWNCKHIANAVIRPQVERLCRDRGYEPPIMCTPEELMGEDIHVER